MRINKFGQVTNKSSDLLLTPQQEEFMKSLLDNGKATSLSLRYGRAVANKVIIPSTIHDMTFDSMEEAFRIGAGIIIDKAYIEYHLDQVEDKDIREHSKNVINSLLSAKGL